MIWELQDFRRISCLALFLSQLFEGFQNQNWNSAAPPQRLFYQGAAILQQEWPNVRLSNCYNSQNSRKYAKQTGRITCLFCLSRPGPATLWAASSRSPSREFWSSDKTNLKLVIISANFVYRVFLQACALINLLPSLPALYRHLVRALLLFQQMTPLPDLQSNHTQELESEQKLGWWLKRHSSIWIIKSVVSGSIASRSSNRWCSG